MRSVRSKDTGPEWAVRHLLHSLGYRYRLHASYLPGTPDLVFPSRKKAIFVHGCFWHAHGCQYGQPPKSRTEYWIPKLERNKIRDSTQISQLNALGWQVLVVWLCQTKDPEKLADRLTSFLGAR